ncbi:protein phosphatase 2C domain-containing protein [Undibacterium sp. Ji67W]|uniref:protein phosphatase 2C domain-containing protein n=1 Tax=Undibacterium sp. Ji67W TaxID=3413042 RepID=UPI003BF1F8C1
MQIDEISESGGTNPNEDLIFICPLSDIITDVVVFDGATSVAEKNYIDEGRGDVAWFVTHFSEILATILRPELSQAESVQRAIEMLRVQFQTRFENKNIPPYAYPIAAMTWVRIIKQETIHINIYALGDCKVLLMNEVGCVKDLDQYHNPQENILKDAIAKLREEGITDVVAIWDKLLPTLRARREEQIFNRVPTVLCMNPQGSFSARESSWQVSKESRLMVMTDGFYRMVDVYQRFTMQEFMRRCVHLGVKEILRDIRQFEEDKLNSGTLSVKKADDASAVLCKF